MEAGIQVWVHIPHQCLVTVPAPLLLVHLPPSASWEAPDGDSSTCIFATRVGNKSSWLLAWAWLRLYHKLWRVKQHMEDISLPPSLSLLSFLFLSLSSPSFPSSMLFYSSMSSALRKIYFFFWKAELEEETKRPACHWFISQVNTICVTGAQHVVHDLLCHVFLQGGETQAGSLIWYGCQCRKWQLSLLCSSANPLTFLFLKV